MSQRLTLASCHQPVQGHHTFGYPRTRPPFLSGSFAPVDLSLGHALCWPARVVHARRPSCSILHLNGVSARPGALGRVSPHQFSSLPAQLSPSSHPGSSCLRGGGGDVQPCLACGILDMGNQSYTSVYFFPSLPHCHSSNVQPGVVSLSDAPPPSSLAKVGFRMLLHWQGSPHPGHWGKSTVWPNPLC